MKNTLTSVMFTIVALALRPLQFADEYETTIGGPSIKEETGQDSITFGEVEANSPQEAKDKAEEALDEAASEAGFGADEQSVESVRNERTGEVTKFN